VDARVGGELGVEGGGEEVAFADQDGGAVAGGEGLDGGAGAGDAGGADEDHLERRAGKAGGRGEDEGVVLAAVGVALDGDVEDGEGALRGIGHVLGEQDGAGAGAEGRRGLDEGLEGGEEVIALEELEHGGGLAAGHDEAVYFFSFFSAFGTGEVFGKADELRGGSEGGEDFGVGFIGALQGEDTDGERCRHSFDFTWPGFGCDEIGDLKRRLPSMPSMREELIQCPFHVYWERSAERCLTVGQ
jgi:hypothetical protein